MSHICLELISWEVDHIHSVELIEAVCSRYYIQSMTPHPPPESHKLFNCSLFQDVCSRTSARSITTAVFQSTEVLTEQMNGDVYCLALVL